MSVLHFSLLPFFKTVARMHYTLNSFWWEYFNRLECWRQEIAKITEAIAISCHVIALLSGSFFLCGKVLLLKTSHFPDRKERFSYPRKWGEFVIYSTWVLQNTAPTETVTEEGTIFYQVISLHSGDHGGTVVKFTGSIPDGVIEIFHWHNPSYRTMALRSTQPLIEMSTRSIFCG